MAISGIFHFSDYYRLALRGKPVGERLAAANQDGVVDQETPSDSRKDKISISEAAKKLSEEEKKELQEMKQREQEVMTHEQAHQSAGGQYASAPQYSYQRGPDGGSYVSDGEVSIDLSSVPNDPQATVQKANQVRAAALAPSDPSPQDLRVAAEASQMAMEAQRKQAEEQREGGQEKSTREHSGEEGEESILPGTFSPPANDIPPSPRPGRNPYTLIANSVNGEQAVPDRRRISLAA